MHRRPLIFIGSRYYMNDLAITADLMGLEILGILDYQFWGNTSEICGIPVIGDERWLDDPENAQATQWKSDCDFFVATLPTGDQTTVESGNNRERLRHQRISILERQNLSTVNLIDPESRIARDLKSRYGKINLGRGIYVAPFVDIMHETSIGDFCVIEHQNFIGHHVTIGRNTTILPCCDLSWCDIGENVVIGYGSSTVNNPRHPRYKIGDWSTVWAHTSITKDLPGNSIYTRHGKILGKYRALNWVVDQ